MKRILLSATALGLLAGCSYLPQIGTGSDTTASTPTAPTAKPAAQTDVAAAPADRTIVTTARDYWGDFGIDQTAMDTNVKPGDDFFKYVNGTWMANFEIPADRSRYGSFTLLAEKSEQRVRYIIEDLAAAGGDPSTLEGKVAAYYNAFMDQDAIEAAGLTPVQPYLDRIAGISNRLELARVFAATGYASPVNGWVDVDSKQPDQYIFYVSTGGLGLPDRDYYFKDDDKSVETREKYVEYLTFLLGEAGYDSPADAAANVMALETKLAKAHWDRALGRNRDLTYNLLTKSELLDLAGNFPALTMLNELGLGDQEKFVVRQVTPTAQEIADAGLTPEEVAKLGAGVAGEFKVAAEAPLEDWKAYLTAHMLSDNASVLPKAIDDATFAFYGTFMRGQEEQRVRWKRGVSAVERALGEAVGKVYAERHFPPASKTAMDELVANLGRAMSANLSAMSWMSEETKIEARDKLAKFTPKIGYPEKFETYDTLVVSPDNAFANSMAAGKWAYADMLSQLGQPIDKTKWFMNPQTVNAYYAPNRNEIVFPAAILQPPFFNADADPAVNYGAIGGVIGHEMGHGFDDQGAKSDGDGRLRDWWSAEDKAAFEALTGALVEQYNTFCPFEEDPDTCVNGKLTLGENIGDLGGVSLAYKAYKMSLNGEEAPVINGLTGDQRFFLAWAQVWRSLYRDEAMRQQLLTGPHSPPYYRVNGIVRNFDAWYEAFGVEEGDALYLPPEERISIW